jgi:hypothetical protein
MDNKLKNAVSKDVEGIHFPELPRQKFFGNVLLSDPECARLLIRQLEAYLDKLLEIPAVVNSKVLAIFLQETPSNM